MKEADEADLPTWSDPPCSPVDVRMEFSMFFFSFIVLSVESKCISERKLLVSN